MAESCSSPEAITRLIFSEVKTYAPGSYAEQLAKADHFDFTLLHSACHHADAQNIRFIFGEVKEHAPEAYPRLLATLSRPQNYSILNEACRYQNYDGVHFVFGEAKEHAPEAYPGLLAQKTDAGHFLPSAVRRSGDRESMAFVLSELKLHAPAILQEMQGVSYQETVPSTANHQSTGILPARRAPLKFNLLMRDAIFMGNVHETNAWFDTTRASVGEDHYLYLLRHFDMYEYAIKSNNLQMVKSIFERARAGLSDTEFKHMLTQGKSHNSHSNLFHYAVRPETSDPDILQYLVGLYYDTFGKEQARELLGEAYSKTNKKHERAYPAAPTGEDGKPGWIELLLNATDEPGKMPKVR